MVVVVVVELAHSPTKDAWDYNKKREQQLQVYDSLYIRNTQLTTYCNHDCTRESGLPFYFVYTEEFHQNFKLFGYHLVEI